MFNQIQSDLLADNNHVSSLHVIHVTCHRTPYLVVPFPAVNFGTNIVIIGNREAQNFIFHTRPLSRDPLIYCVQDVWTVCTSPPVVPHRSVCNRPSTLLTKIGIRRSNDGNVRHSAI
jgi:hypothetical protein